MLHLKYFAFEITHRFAQTKKTIGILLGSSIHGNVRWWFACGCPRFCSWLLTATSKDKLMLIRECLWLAKSARSVKVNCVVHSPFFYCFLQGVSGKRFPGGPNTILKVLGETMGWERQGWSIWTFICVVTLGYILVNIVDIILGILRVLFIYV